MRAPQGRRGLGRSSSGAAGLLGHECGQLRSPTCELAQHAEDRAAAELTRPDASDEWVWGSREVRAGPAVTLGLSTIAIVEGKQPDRPQSLTHVYEGVNERFVRPARCLSLARAAFPKGPASYELRHLHCFHKHFTPWKRGAPHSCTHAGRGNARHRVLKQIHFPSHCNTGTGAGWPGGRGSLDVEENPKREREGLQTQIGRNEH